MALSVTEGSTTQTVVLDNMASVLTDAGGSGGYDGDVTAFLDSLLVHNTPTT